jgi:pentatricopeptide repeat protein
MATEISPDEKPNEVLKRVERHLAAKEPIDARSLVEPGLARWPKSVGFHLANAQVIEAEGRAVDAMTAYRAAVEQFPMQQQPASALARACCRAGQLEEARAALALARERGLAEEVCLDLELAIAHAASDWSAVVTTTEKLVARQAEPSGQLLFALAQARARGQNAAGAETAAEQALALDPQHTGAALLLARLRLERGDAVGAEETALRALAARPDADASCTLRRARCDRAGRLR